MRWKKEFNPDYFANKIRTIGRASNSNKINICGLIGIAKCKNVTEICTTTNNTTAKIKMKPVIRKRKYIPKMKCVVEGCKALSRGNGVGKNGEYCLRHGGRRYPRKCTYDGCNHYILRSKLCAKHYLLLGERIKVAQHRGSGHSTTGKLHPAKAGIRSKCMNTTTTNKCTTACQVCFS